ncbi:MAG: PorV/PorQ family protein [Melioribacteraceae bacterium]|nr:PorV/PorQ family protein [Melioribacteraceae bacterium]
MKIFINIEIRITLLFSMLISICLFAQSDHTKVGTTSANFLQMEIGARAIGLGGAYVALADDATSLFWNSAGIGLVENGNAVYQFGSRYADIAHHYAGFVYGLGNDDKIGIMIDYVDVGEMEITTLNEPDGTGQNFSASNVAIGLSYARQLTDRVYVGVLAKYIQENIWMESATGFAVDIGALYIIEENGIRIGMNLANLGPDMKINDGANIDFYKEKVDGYPGSPTPKSTLATKTFPLPMVFSMGFAIDLVGRNSIVMPNVAHKFLLALSANDSFDAPFRGNFGIEYTWQDIFSLRSGYHIGYDTKDLSLGVGLNLKQFTSLDVVLDYVWNNYGDLGAINVFTLGINF